MQDAARDEGAICTVRELEDKLRAGGDFLLLDVRTEEELEIASLRAAKHVPLHELEERTPELEPWRDKEIVVMCHVGGRSAQAQMYLSMLGFEKVRNLMGGIDSYSQEVDSSIPRYE